MLADGYKERKEKMKRERERERPSAEGGTGERKREVFQGRCRVTVFWLASNPSFQGSHSPSDPPGWTHLVCQEPLRTAPRLPIILSEFLIGPRITPPRKPPRDISGRNNAQSQTHSWNRRATCAYSGLVRAAPCHCMCLRSLNYI